MKRFVSGLAMSAMVIFFLCGTSYAGKIAIEDMELFGVKLKSSTREELHQALLKAGFTVSRGYESDDWTDCYDVNGKFTDAKQLVSIFDESTGEFVRAFFYFEGPRTAKDVQRISGLLSEVYGPPTRERVDPETGQGGFIWESGVWRIGVLLSMPEEEVAVVYLNRPAMDRWEKAKGSATEKEGGKPPVKRVE